MTMDIMDWRARCYAAEKWLSRLLGISLNQAVREAAERLNHPLGKDEPWQGTKEEWDLINVAILARAEKRLRTQSKGAACTCAECRGVWVDLDALPSVQPGATPPSATEPTVPRLLKSDSSVSAAPSDATTGLCATCGRSETCGEAVEGALCCHQPIDWIPRAPSDATMQGERCDHWKCCGYCAPASSLYKAQDLLAAAEQSAERMAEAMRSIANSADGEDGVSATGHEMCVEAACTALSAFEAERAGKGTR